MAYKPFKSRNVNQLAKETPVISNVLEDLARNCRDQTKKLTDCVYENQSDSDVGDDSLCGEGVNVVHLESNEFVVFNNFFVKIFNVKESGCVWFKL